MADEAARELPQDDISITFRDSRAIIKAWAKKQTQTALMDLVVDPFDAKTKEEGTWPREQQVVAAQLRAKKVRLVGEWPRIFNPRMALSCRFCTPADHAGVEQLWDEQQGRARYNRDKVTCPVCLWPYSKVDKYNKHLLKPTKALCKAGADPIILNKNNKKSIGDETWFERYERLHKIEVQRLPSTGPTETLDHVLHQCEAVRRMFSTGVESRDLPLPGDQCSRHGDATSVLYTHNRSFQHRVTHLFKTFFGRKTHQGQQGKRIKKAPA